MPDMMYSSNFNPRTPLQSAMISGNIIVGDPRYFNPRTPLQSAIGSNPHSIVKFIAYFNPRTPLQSAMLKGISLPSFLYISIHALHYRVRFYQDLNKDGHIGFQSTHSITECDIPGSKLIFGSGKFQSTHSITECDAYPEFTTGGAKWISIHALHYRVR